MVGIAVSFSEIKKSVEKAGLRPKKLLVPPSVDAKGWHRLIAKTAVVGSPLMGFSFQSDKISLLSP